MTRQTEQPTKARTTSTYIGFGQHRCTSCGWRRRRRQTDHLDWIYIFVCMTISGYRYTECEILVASTAQQWNAAVESNWRWTELGRRRGVDAERQLLPSALISRWSLITCYQNNVLEWNRQTDINQPLTKNEQRKVWNGWNVLRILPSQ